MVRPFSSGFGDGAGPLGRHRKIRRGLGPSRIDMIPRQALHAPTTPFTAIVKGPPIRPCPLILSYPPERGRTLVKRRWPGLPTTRPANVRARSPKLMRGAAQPGQPYDMAHDYWPVRGAARRP